MTTPTTAERFLRGFHREHPGVTAAGLGRGRLADGRSSYRLLADAIPPDARVLDLACGDGPLLELLPGRAVGADFAEGELAAARRRVQAPLVQARAQALPFAAAVFDACAAHMAFPLFEVPESVAAEVARVLRPGGALVLVLRSGGPVDRTYQAFLDVARPRLAPIPSLGDRRSRTPEGLAGILGAAGFTEPVWCSSSLDLSGPPWQVWAVLDTLYDVLALPGVERAELRAEFLTATGPLLRPDGVLPLALPLSLVTARLAVS